MSTWHTTFSTKPYLAIIIAFLQNEKHWPSVINQDIRINQSFMGIHKLFGNVSAINYGVINSHSVSTLFAQRDYYQSVLGCWQVFPID